MSHEKCDDFTMSALADLAKERLFVGKILEHSGNALTAIRVLISACAKSNYSDVCSSVRTNIEDMIDELIAILDATDGDCDFEVDTDLEPNLGWANFDPCGVPVHLVETGSPSRLSA